MLAVPGVPPGTDAWSTELKFDGMRAIVVCKPRGYRIYSRAGRDVTSSFPDVIDKLRAVVGNRSTTLDGELTATGAGGHSFARLQRRIFLPRPRPPQIRATPIELVAFDILSLDDRTTTSLTYDGRRALLLGEWAFEPPGLRITPAWPGSEAHRVLAATAELGFEGIISKARNSVYRSGRHRTWVKTTVRKRIDSLIGGWIPGGGRHAQTFGTLILAGHDLAGRLTYVGTLGTGFTDRSRQILRSAFDSLETPAPEFVGPAPPEVLRMGRWCKAILVVDVACREVSADGALRHPSFRALNPDADPDTVLRPELQ